jgi:hypothetical protein
MAPSQQTSDPRPESTDPTGTADPAPARGPRAALWVLVVLGGFIAMGALWYALFGGPQTIGPEPSGGPASGTTSQTPRAGNAPAEWWASL